MNSRIVCLSLLLTATLLPLHALAAKPKPPVMKRAPFVEEYMQCGKLRAALKENPDATLGCNAKYNLAFCDRLDALPQDIQSKIALEIQCEFLGGELTGDAQKDKDIDALSNELGCPLSSLGTVSLLKKHWGNEKESRALLFFTDEYMENESKCLKDEDGKGAAVKEEPKPEAPKAEKKKTSKKLKAVKTPTPPAPETPAGETPQE